MFAYHGRNVDKFKFINKFQLMWNNYASDATIESQPFKLFKLDAGPSNKIKVTKDEAIKYYTQMKHIRVMEHTSGNLYMQKAIRGFLHLYTGQEAVGVGVKAVMSNDDCIVTSYRAHGWTYLMGVDSAAILAELTGRQTGCGRGKGGSMHMYADNFFGGNGIVGGQTPLGAGIALSLQYKGLKAVCYTLYGDGAANQGQLFEALNICKLWNLPCVYLCENNGYGMGTAAHRSSANTNYYTRGDYAPGIWVDGMDVLAVREAAKFAKDYCLSGKGPIIIEANTYRYFGHSMSDPGTSYRTREEVDNVKKTRDCIANFKVKILDSKLVTEDELKKIDDEIKKENTAAEEKAKSDKVTPYEELSADVYVNCIEGYIRNVLQYQPLDHKRHGAAVNSK